MTSLSLVAPFPTQSASEYAHMLFVCLPPQEAGLHGCEGTELAVGPGALCVSKVPPLGKQWLLCDRFQGVVMKVKHDSTSVNASEASRLLRHAWTRVCLLCEVRRACLGTGRMRPCCHLNPCCRGCSSARFQKD